MTQAPLSPTNLLSDALTTLNKVNHTETDGKYLEELVIKCAPIIKEYNIKECYSWANWPDRLKYYPNSSGKDVGIDVVAICNDGKLIAIQCKSRKLDENDHGNSISKGEIDKFISTTSNNVFSERWVITNGDNSLSSNIAASISNDQKPIKNFNITSDIEQQLNNAKNILQTKTELQREVVQKCVSVLKEHVNCDSGGLPVGQARGKLIMPCGTGKTRTSLRIIEELTQVGEVAVVLAPSIALVDQIRKEYLLNTNTAMRTLAVCSDKTVGFGSNKEGQDISTNPFADVGGIKQSEIKGTVTTDTLKIGAWIENKSVNEINVIFGTYQSSLSIAMALQSTETNVKVLICDEAHRTAGLRKNRLISEKQIRDFTVCHDNDAFPATYRIYQTATPRVFKTGKVSPKTTDEWVVRSMDDEATFGVELYSMNYSQAVSMGLLSDYKIIAIGINDPEAYKLANRLAKECRKKGKKLSAEDCLKGLAFVLTLSGATRDSDNNNIVIKSCIAFTNSIDKSKKLVKQLGHKVVKEWLQKYNQENNNGKALPKYTLEHLDASSNANERDVAKGRLEKATEESPHAISNVGIFGEGVDAPALSAVAFLESRKSPVDITQAMGRAMRTSSDKQVGYIICPILIPPNADPIDHLCNSNSEEGWKTLGQVLNALSQHDSRIEENLADFIELKLPESPKQISTFIAIGGKDKKLSYWLHTGSPGEANRAVKRVLRGETTMSNEFVPSSKFEASNRAKIVEGEIDPPSPLYIEPAQIISGKRSQDGSHEMRISSVECTSRTEDNIGIVNIEKTKKKGKAMINKGIGNKLPYINESKRLTPEELAERRATEMLTSSGLKDYMNAIQMNLLSKSGLNTSKSMRDQNILEDSVKEATHQLMQDNLQKELNQYFKIDCGKNDKPNNSANGCTIAALILLMAALHYQKISSDKWLPGIKMLSEIKNKPNITHMLRREWGRIRSYSFRPIFGPALDVIDAIEDTGKTAGLERALRHITTEAERISATYSTMGTDHVGPLFNKIMGNQDSDGAFFTRPISASMAARLTLDVCGDQDWTSHDVWKNHKTTDLACGSGTLLRAILTDMMRRAKSQGASKTVLANMQKRLVEESLVGLDINPISLQLAASALITGNHNIRYKQIRLHKMPYGPSDIDLYEPASVTPAGSLELLAHDLTEQAESDSVLDSCDPEVESAKDSLKGTKIVLMNPPFSNRKKMGEKFPSDVKKCLSQRMDRLVEMAINRNPEMKALINKNSVKPGFVALADQLLNNRDNDGVLAMINPTIALSSPSGLEERLYLARNYHIHTVLVSHCPGQVHLSESSISESLIIAKRCKNNNLPTRIVRLDRFPANEEEVTDFHTRLVKTSEGMIGNGWGEVSYWSAKFVNQGDLTAAVWASPVLANTAQRYATNKNTKTFADFNFLCHDTRSELRKTNFIESKSSEFGCFPIIDSKGEDGQKVIQSTPDAFWQPTNPNEEERLSNGGTYPQTDNLLEKAGYLLITSGQGLSSARLTAVASDCKYVGRGFLPITGLSVIEAKAVAVVINSTYGRLQLLRNAGRTINFPQYNPITINNLRIPNIKDETVLKTLSDCWEATKHMEVLQFRDGECEVRTMWDEAVAKAMGWNPADLEKQRLLLHEEPHVSGLGYNQYRD